MTSSSVNLTWRAPDKDGGSKITHYILEMKQSSDIKFKVKDARVSGTTCDVTDLSEGVAYEFPVFAVNKVGAGITSAWL